MMRSVHPTEGNTRVQNSGTSFRLDMLPLFLLVPGLFLLYTLLTAAADSTDSGYETSGLFSTEVLSTSRPSLHIKPTADFSRNELYLRGERRSGHLLAGEPIHIDLDHFEAGTSYILDLGNDKTVQIRRGGADFMFPSDGEYQAKLRMERGQNMAVQDFTIHVSH